MFRKTIRSETSADLAELNVRLLAKTAKAFNMPVVLSTVWRCVPHQQPDTARDRGRPSWREADRSELP